MQAAITLQELQFWNGVMSSFSLFGLWVPVNSDTRSFATFIILHLSSSFICSLTRRAGIHESEAV